MFFLVYHVFISVMILDKKQDTFLLEIIVYSNMILNLTYIISIGLTESQN